LINFFIEFRFHGYPKQYLKDLIREVFRKFKVKGAIKKRAVPHMTLYGPSQTTDIYKVFAAIEKIGKRYTFVPFKVGGFGCFNGREGKVIHAGITASPELEKLRQELAKELSKISTPRPWDTLPDYRFHTTIAFKDIDHKFNQIWHYLKAKGEPDINQYLLRITVLDRDRKILREYDLMLKRWLNRQQALSGDWWWRTVNKSRELQGLPSERQPSLLDWLREIFK
jgi:2'-5' RNA ligase